MLLACSHPVAGKPAECCMCERAVESWCLVTCVQAGQEQNQESMNSSGLGAERDLPTNGDVSVD